MRLHVMDLGELEADEAWFIEGAGVSTLGNPKPPSVRRRIKLIGILIRRVLKGRIPRVSVPFDLRDRRGKREMPEQRETLRNRTHRRRKISWTCSL